MPKLKDEIRQWTISERTIDLSTGRAGGGLAAVPRVASIQLAPQAGRRLAVSGRRLLEPRRASSRGGPTAREQLGFQISSVLRRARAVVPFQAGKRWKKDYWLLGGLQLMQMAHVWWTIACVCLPRGLVGFPINQLANYTNTQLCLEFFLANLLGIPENIHATANIRQWSMDLWCWSISSYVMNTTWRSSFSCPWKILLFLSFHTFFFLIYASFFFWTEQGVSPYWLWYTTRKDNTKWVTTVQKGRKNYIGISCNKDSNATKYLLLALCKSRANWFLKW